jgi:hypothetical protein
VEEALKRGQELYDRVQHEKDSNGKLWAEVREIQKRAIDSLNNGMPISPRHVEARHYDNPKHRDHQIYQRMVNRVTALLVSIVVAVMLADSVNVAGLPWHSGGLLVVGLLFGLTVIVALSLVIVNVMCAMVAVMEKLFFYFSGR